MQAQQTSKKLNSNFSGSSARTVGLFGPIDVSDAMTRPAIEARQVPKLIDLPVKKIHFSSTRKRRPIDVKSDAALEASIREAGVITPLIVKQLDNWEYEVLSGERRLRICKKLNLPKVHCIVQTTKNEAVCFVIENLQRQELPPLHEALALLALKKEGRLTDEQLGQLAGRSRNSITMTLGLANLPSKIVDEALTMSPMPSRGVLIEIAQCDDSDLRMELWELAKSKATRAQIRAARQGAQQNEPQPQLPLRKALPTLKALARHLASVGEATVTSLDKSALQQIKAELSEMLAQVSKLEAECKR